MVNFTKENEAELRELIADSVLARKAYVGPIGQTYTVFDLVDGLTPNSLVSLIEFTKNKITKLSVEDDWADNPNADKIEELTASARLMSLIRGWKLYQKELADNAKEKERLTKQLDDLIESQKTPAELISELKQKIAELS